jgi:hypothetical protein
VMEMAVESIEMASGAIPRPGRVPEQRLLSPEIGLRWRQRCGTFHGRILDDLGLLPQREYIGGRTMSEGGPGATPPGGAARGWPAPPYGAAASWLLSVSPLDSVFMSGK